MRVILDGLVQGLRVREGDDAVDRTRHDRAGREEAMDDHGPRSFRGSAKSTDSVARRERLPGPSETRTGSHISHMSPLRARVQRGRLVLDEATTLPEGTVVELVADDEGDDLNDEERLALHEALSASWKSAEAGRLRSSTGTVEGCNLKFAGIAG